MGSCGGPGPAATIACTENLHSRLVSMDKGFNHSHGFLGSLLTTVGGQNKSDSRWTTPATADNISFRNDWRNPMQCEQRKEGIKKVTWDEMVQVRTIEPCPGRGRGKWHHPERKRSRGSPWDESQPTNIHNSVTSPIYDL